MEENNKIIITVHLIHGNPLKFEVVLTEVKELGLGSDIDQALSRNAMAIEAEGKLYFIPYSNVQYIECSPVPDGLPLNMIRNAKRLLS
jgi:hypothetical protein